MEERIRSNEGLKSRETPREKCRDSMLNRFAEGRRRRRRREIVFRREDRRVWEFFRETRDEWGLRHARGAS